MKSLALIFILGSFCAFGQGTIVFNNRIGNVDAPVRTPDGRGWGALPGAASQLFLVGAGGTLTPLLPTTTFRTSSAAAQFYMNQVIVTVPGIPAGSPATVRMRSWAFADSYETAVYRGESNDVTISQLGGIPPGGGAPIPDPLMSGLLSLVLVPEPSTIAVGTLGVFLLGFLRRKAV